MKLEIYGRHRSGVRPVCGFAVSRGGGVSIMLSDMVFLATSLVWVLMAYAAAGVVFAVLFAIRGAAVLDGGAEKTTIWFKALIMPGAAALWPLLLLRWLARVREERGRGRS